MPDSSRFDLEKMQAMCRNTLSESLGIELISVHREELKARMPVDHRTHQPAGMLHGGASVALAETLGSMGSVQYLTDPDTIPVGIEINANHLRSVRTGYVTGTAKPIRIGRTLHVWNIEIHDDDNNLVCVSRLSVQITKKKS